MALESFVAGRYTSAWNGVDCGITDQGIELQYTTHAESIALSDAYGSSIVDFVYAGADVALMFLCKAFKPGSINIWAPWGALGVLQTVGTAAAPVGRLGSSVAAPLVLSAVTGTAFNTSGATVINTLTAPLAILAPESPSSLVFNSRLRQVPIKLQCLPSESSTGGTTTTRHYSTTAIGFIASALCWLAALSPTLLA